MLTCSICVHKQREAIEKELVGGRSLRDVAGRYRVSKSALDRHKSGHLRAELIARKEASDEARVDSVLSHVTAQVERMQGLVAQVDTILKGAGKDPDLALRAVREMANLNREERGTLELIAKLTGQLAPGGAPGSTQVLIVVPDRTSSQMHPASPPADDLQVIDLGPENY